MEYILAHDLKATALRITEILGFDHIDMRRVTCVRSKGSRSRRVIARVHSLPKAMQLGMGCNAFYVIEFLERFEKCSEREKTETIIHELLHIPKNFGGGFRHHNYVKNKKVAELYNKFIGHCNNSPQ